MAFYELDAFARDLGFVSSRFLDDEMSYVLRHIARPPFIHHNGKFFEGPNMTAEEFKAFDVRNLPASSVSGEGKLHGS